MLILRWKETAEGFFYTTQNARLLIRRMLFDGPRLLLIQLFMEDEELVVHPMA